MISSVIPATSSQFLQRWPGGSFPASQTSSAAPSCAPGRCRGSVQLGSHPFLAAQVAVGGDGKAVGFIPDALHQIQPLRIARQHQRALTLPGRNRASSSLASPAAGHLAGQVELLQHLHRPPQLAFAAVHDQQVRQNGRRQASGFSPTSFFSSSAACQRLKRRASTSSMLAKSSAPSDGFDIEAPVMLLVGHALLKHHHAAHCGRALNVGNVIAFDAVGRVGQSQRLLQFAQRLGSVCGYRLPTGFSARRSVSTAFSWPSAPVRCWLPRCGTLISTFSPAAFLVQPLLDDDRFFHVVRAAALLWGRKWLHRIDTAR